MARLKSCPSRALRSSRNLLFPNLRFPNLAFSEPCFFSDVTLARPTCFAKVSNLRRWWLRRSWFWSENPQAWNPWRTSFEIVPRFSRNHSPPGEAAEHGEVRFRGSRDGRDQDVYPVSQILVMQRVDGLRDAFRAVGVRPAVILPRRGLRRCHLERGVGHGERINSCQCLAG